MLAVFFFVAIAEWVVSVISLRMIARGDLLASMVIVFVENILNFWVFFAIVENVNDWGLALSYSLGAVVGTAIGIIMTKGGKNENENEVAGVLLPSLRESGDDLVKRVNRLLHLQKSV
jgi:hypothetical protein